MIHKIKVLAISFFKSILYTLYSLFSYKNGINKDSNFIVSLTTYNKRLPFVYLTIESILRQKFKPRSVILVLSNKDCSTERLPYLLTRLQKRGLEIKFVDDNYKSYKKLSYCFDYEFNQGDFIVTADDDVFYPNYWLEKFQSKVLENSTIIYCYRGRIITFKNNDSLIDYNEWPIANTSNVSDNYLIPTGVSGVCYPYEAISNLVCHFDLIDKFCPNADDIWYKLMTTKNGCKSALVENDSVHFTPIITGFEKGLEKVNVHNNQNVKQFIQSMSALGITRNDFNYE
ncbi:glycosyltransferase family A protein [Vibrio pelagius]|uniref:glycosyltransferase family A protein n=1 Tax=Vibrio pelagius TaxID=28169 RepID=UPI0021C3BFE3|nr:glycosyltransferase family A protein [Vibrio pelagius]